MIRPLIMVIRLAITRDVTMIIIKANQRDALACENVILTHAGKFGEKAAQEQAKTHGGSSSFKSPAPKPLAIDSPRPPSAKKGTYGTSASNQQPVDQSVNLKKKEPTNKEVPAELNNPEKKFWVSTCLDPK
jgi:hypothetical protein